MQTGKDVTECFVESAVIPNCLVMQHWFDAFLNSQELNYIEEEQHRTKSTLQSRIKDREDEIQKLRNQVRNLILMLFSQGKGNLLEMAAGFVLLEKKSFSGRVTYLHDSVLSSS